MNLTWYLHRLAAMGPGEMAHRARDVAVKAVTGLQEESLRAKGSSRANGGFATPFRHEPTRPSTAALESLSATAASLLDGRLPVFGVERTDMGESPDWFLDPKTGLRAAEHDLSFRINHRMWPGSLKHVWEPSRHQHLTVLASAAHFNGDEAAADLLLSQLESWWQANPPFRGVNWTSGIELGMRLISWVWMRRLLHQDDRAASWFEGNPRFLDQLYAHQLWLDRLPSHGTSANNHAIAEWAGQLAATCAFPIFPESAGWRERAARELAFEARRQVDADGVDRELATEYHGFVAELLLIAGLEGEAAGWSLGDEFWIRVRSMIDVVAAVLDTSGRPPRQGDSDDAIALVVDGDGFDRWASLLATGGSLFGSLPWWPAPQEHGDVRSSVLSALAAPLDAVSGDRPPTRPTSFQDSGMTILRSATDASEVWCRCDAGPLGFMSTAAHGHDDALSVEVRVDGVDLLADPGTYCYQMEPLWRSYFRSIRAHNTLELVKAKHSQQTGSFIWSSSEQTGPLPAREGDGSSWSGHCVRSYVDGGEIEHRRSVFVNDSSVTIEDEVDRETPAISRLHLGPDIGCQLDGGIARLSWEFDGRARTATLDLPHAMTWRSVRGDEEEPLGWFSPAYDVRVPAVTLEGAGEMAPGQTLTTRLVFDRVPEATRS